MNEKKKLQKTRAVIRKAVTKIMNKLKNELDSQSVDTLHEHFDYLNENLRELDKKIQNIIKVDKEFDAEIQSAFGYNEKISVLCSKIQIQTKNLSKNDSSVLSQTTLNVQNDSLNNSINGSSVSSNRNVNSVRLPKLQIDKYFGDPCLWLEFWNKFQKSIDRNETLTKVDKFSYLKSLLGGGAGNVVNGFALSEDNYDNALILLKKRFGREEIVVNAHMSKLLNLYPVKDSNNVIGLRKLYDICKIQTRSLESLNVTSGMYGHLLQPILLKLLPEDLALDFNRKQLGKKEKADWCEEVPQLTDFSITRCYFSDPLVNNFKTLELHLFSDASTKAYRTVAYLPVTSSNKEILTSFVASKNRKAPLKTLTLPRLELMGALLSARLSSNILKALKLDIPCFVLTDSKITYFWVRGQPERFKPFVKNRIQEIQKLTSPSNWHHCPGIQNPADIVSRGVKISRLLNDTSWLQGPEWLRLPPGFWPESLKTKIALSHLI
ncbi:integrase catalytic domain-containing protein [Trichonephila inaurata madagascariensis]|uniref:Integrase catalytic domain-containing protein n=1 Tax=Trichonephila inaurata madagascariensis TaxID=2747483 RepID=A0A8X6MCA6_9ARAC|nr:integrase catalytic domain-containing protein [Trichonephila inaurata madagascariensis]